MSLRGANDKKGRKVFCKMVKGFRRKLPRKDKVADGLRYFFDFLVAVARGDDVEGLKKVVPEELLELFEKVKGGLE